MVVPLGAWQLCREIAIHACTFHEAKASQIHAIACRVVAIHGGVLPCDAEILRSFHGIGPKCANLVMGMACQQPFAGTVWQAYLHGEPTAMLHLPGA